MLRQEWHRLFKNKILLIVTVAVIAIPTNLYHTFPWIHVGPIREYR